MKVIAITFGIFIFSIASYGQAYTGIKVGSGMGNFSGENFKSDVTYEAGFFSKATGDGGIGILAELDYHVCLTKILQPEIDLEQHFAGLRLSATYNFTENIFAGGGFHFAYNTLNNIPDTVVKSNNVNPFLVGGQIVAGYDLKRFAFLIRYEHHFTVPTKEALIKDENIFKDTHFNLISIVAGFKF